jgi:hypothetical protein
VIDRFVGDTVGGTLDLVVSEDGPGELCVEISPSELLELLVVSDQGGNLATTSVNGERSTTVLCSLKKMSKESVVCYHVQH